MKTLIAVGITLLLSTEPCKCDLMLQGQVFDERTGEGVPHARVTIEHPKSTMSDPADYDGMFVFARICPGKQTIKVTAQGYHEQTLSLDLTKELETLKVTLKPLQP